MLPAREHKSIIISKKQQRSHFLFEKESPGSLRAKFNETLFIRISSHILLPFCSLNVLLLKVNFIYLDLNLHFE